MINFLEQKGAAFVNLCVTPLHHYRKQTSLEDADERSSTSISAAQKAIDGIASVNTEYAGLSIRPGRDRCSNAPRETLKYVSVFRHARYD